MTKYKVVLAEELLETTKDPVAGLIELLDNALDADANNIAVTIDRDALGKPVSVIVSDDGTGMSQTAVLNTFLLFGRSHKTSDTLGRGGRVIRGRHGQGRFAATAIGTTVRWTTTAPGPAGANEQVVVTLQGQDRDEFDVSEDPSPAGDLPSGTVVQVSNLVDRARRLESQATRTRLGQLYASYLERQPSLVMRVDTKPLKPSAHWIRRPLDLPLSGPDDVPDAPTSIRIVEWDSKVAMSRPVLVLATGNKDPLLDLPGLAAAPFKYTAYLAWDRFSEQPSTLPLGENAPGDIGKVIAAAFDAVATWVARRAQGSRAAYLSQWRLEDSYPYPDSPPATVVEEAERALFDVVATTAGPALAGSDPASRRLSLALIREALRHGPSDVTRILQQVLHLPPADMRTLSALLDRTSLSAVIATAQLVSDRARVLDQLDALTAETRPRKGVLEKPVHEIAAANPWLFGDAWSLARSEAGLTKVLNAHRGLLGDLTMTDLPDERVTMDGHLARVDVLLARTLENAANSRERLVVEVKRPGLPLGPAEATQIERYAERISGDGRFTGQLIHWEFLAVGSSVEHFVRGRGDARGYLPNHFGTAGSTVDVRVTSWDTLLKENRHRLDFVADALSLSAQESSSQAAIEEARSLTTDSDPTQSERA